MKFEERVQRCKELTEQRDKYTHELNKINTELAALFNTSAPRHIVKENGLSVVTKSKRWSRKYAACRCCNGTDKKHITHGLCQACSSAKRIIHLKETGEVLPRVAEIRRTSASQHQEPKLIKYKCSDCNHIFSDKGKLLDVVCPECKSIHLTKIK